jgi:hypothetical protein
MTAQWRVYLVSVLLSCVAAAATALVTVRILISRPVSISNMASVPDTAVLEGIAEVPWGKELEVFYKVPFVAPPNLTLTDFWECHCELTEQKAGSFKLKRVSTGVSGEPDVAKAKWKAEGQPAK